ncbi:MAG: hypothetical protein DMF87_24225 [Acidobacteria bacterium]|nr:MAG: hypothetical protein DMF88_23955 [Acidobacteriota bacterium]PYR73915.1 MAG: hypothetical protein DMF87_24225 [Acidobacteriota bacterium]
MRRHNERIYRAARSIVKDEDEAEDVMQQAYVNARSSCCARSTDSTPPKRRSASASARMS